MTNTNVNFKVKSIIVNDADNSKVDVKVKYNDDEFERIITRKMYEIKEGLKAAFIDGCRIEFFEMTTKSSGEHYYVFNKVFRTYDTKGKKVTKSSSKKNDNKLVTMPGTEKLEEFANEYFDKDGNAKHEKYDQIKACLDVGIPVYLAGPAGSGKNFTVEQIAKENGWNFYFSNSIQQEYKLTGFIDAGGDYHETEFYKACTDENECVFFLDEIDASIPEVLVLLNAAIANGYFEFPNGRVDFDHVHFVAAGNTVGMGADDMYTGRMVLDQATLDRFAIIDFDYSKRIEMAITNKNNELINFIHQLRDEANQKGIRATFSYRCMTMVIKLEGKMELTDIIKIAIVKGLNKDTINTFNPIGDSKYHKAFNEVKMAA